MGLAAKLSLLIVACSSLCFVNCRPPITVPVTANPQALVNYLQKYGYLKPLDPRTGEIRSAAELQIALQYLQQMAGLKPTGDFNDPALVKLLNTSRCGVSDLGPSDVLKRRKRRYAHHGTKWEGKTHLTYRIENYTPDLSQADVDRTIHDALAMWSAITPLTFERVTDPRITVDIRIKFARGYHDDGYPFDGQGGTLAHAFYPLDNKGISGDAHFDEDEFFTLRSPGRGIDLFWVAVHEFGHSLGLQHSNHPDAIMYPFYRGYVKNFKLHPDDVRGLQSLYGSKSHPKTTREPKTVTPHVEPTVPFGIPNKCKTSFDAFAQTEQGYTYAFKGEHFWPVGEAGAWTEALKIKDYWPLLEADIDASFSYNGYTYFIKGDKFWKFKNRTPVKPTEHKPLPITHEELKLKPDVQGMDAALHWARNDQIYFFKGDRYWKYDPYHKRFYPGYPRKTQEGWRGAVPDNINAAVQWTNKKSYFFKGTDYQGIDDFSVSVAKVDPPYPRKTAHYWMGCSPEKVKGGKISPVGNSAFGLVPNILMFAVSALLTKLS